MSDAKTYLDALLGRGKETTSLPPISEVPLTGDRGLASFLSSVKQWISTASGDGGVLGRLVSWSDLVDSGLARLDPDGNPIPGESAAAEATLDYTPPPAPTGLTASGAMTNILLEWAPPIYSNYAYTEVWAAATDALGTAVLIGTTPASLYSHATGPAQTRYYWVRHVSKADVAGPYNASAGVFGATSDDPAFLLDLLANEYGGSSDAAFFQLDAPTVIDGVTIPAGTYMRAAYIHDASVTNAKIANAAIDDAKISNLSASKLTAGSLAVGEYIESDDYVPGVSGWRVYGDGTAEFANVSVRGDVNATSGSITGLTITGGTLQTATTGQRIQMDSQGLLFLTADTPAGKYGSFKYGSGAKYGAGVLVFFNNVNRKIPFYVQSEQTVADIHLYNRASDPTGAAEIGDLAVVAGKLKICTVTGTPGTWVVVGTQT